MYKHETQPFAIVVSPGESTCVVLKRSKNIEATHWPPKGIAVFQKWSGFAKALQLAYISSAEWLFNLLIIYKFLFIDYIFNLFKEILA